MTEPTHKQFAVFFAFLFLMVLYTEGLSSIYYYLSIPIVIMSAKVGAEIPDVDHYWGNVKNKTVLNWIINKLIHLTGGKHRSWQTHSIDIVIVASILAYYVPRRLYTLGVIDIVNAEVANILLFGFMSGWISHIISDMLTSAGVRLFCFRKFKIALVPKELLGFRFNTGHQWEAMVFKVIRMLNMGLGVICVLYPYLSKLLGLFTQSLS